MVLLLIQPAGWRVCRTTLSAKIQPNAAKPVAQRSWIITPKRNRIFFSRHSQSNRLHFFQLLQTNWMLEDSQTHQRSALTSSTRPNPPTPRVAMTSRWSKGLDEENSETSSFSWMTSGDRGWLWWRDTDLLDGRHRQKQSVYLNLNI